MTDTAETQTATEIPGWRIELPSGFILCESEIKAAHIGVVCGLLNKDTWEASRPLDGPMTLFAWVALAMALEQQRAPEDTIHDVMQLSYAEVLDYIKLPAG
jgi:hypothetical protein